MILLGGCGFLNYSLSLCHFHSLLSFSEQSQARYYIKDFNPLFYHNLVMFSIHQFIPLYFFYCGGRYWCTLQLKSIYNAICLSNRFLSFNPFLISIFQLGYMIISFFCLFFNCPIERFVFCLAHLGQFQPFSLSPSLKCSVPLLVQPFYRHQYRFRYQCLLHILFSFLHLLAFVVFSASLIHSFCKGALLFSSWLMDYTYQSLSYIVIFFSPFITCHYFILPSLLRVQDKCYNSWSSNSIALTSYRKWYLNL